MVRSPVEICLGTSPSQAAKSRPLVNTSPAPIAATIALEMIGPTPGTLINRSQPASWRASASISADRRSNALIQPSPIARQVLDDLCHVRRKVRGGSAENARQLGAQKALPVSHSETALQQKSADLIDDAGALTD